MSVDMRVIPVEGVTALPDLAGLPDEAELARDRRELLLLNIASGLAVMLVCCAWVLIALE